MTGVWETTVPKTKVGKQVGTACLNRLPSSRTALKTQAELYQLERVTKLPNNWESNARAESFPVSKTAIRKVTEEPWRSHTTSVGCTVQEDPRAQASTHGEERQSESRQGRGNW